MELVHFLFQPLAMVVHNFCGFDIPRSIKTPLLQRDAILFLRNCTTTQEMELLERLGDFWMKSRLTPRFDFIYWSFQHIPSFRRDFPKEMYFPPYVPHFLSGWEPPPIPVAENEDHRSAATIAAQAKEARLREKARKSNGVKVGRAQVVTR